MLGIISRRLFVLLGILLLGAVFSGGFIDELAIINGDAIVAAFVADFLRYSLSLLALLMVASAVAEDYESRQFERLLTMPLARWQYIAAQALVIACLCLLLVLPAFLLLWFYSSLTVGLYWAAALWLELLLISLLGLLAMLSLEKIPQAVLFTLAIYLLAKLSGLVVLMLAESVRLSDGSAVSRAVEYIFSAILFVLPANSSFAQNDVFFERVELLPILGEQLFSVAIYASFLLSACLVDFYRKEFNF
jgi:ABC-type Na+ efflux pump permease subunit